MPGNGNLTPEKPSEIAEKMLAFSFLLCYTTLRG